jgi:hypothetical protein
MKHPVLFAYQTVAGLSDTVTGAMLCVAPQVALRLMGLHIPADATPYVSYIGAFVFSVGLSYLYGALLIAIEAPAERVEMVWLTTAFTRSAVAVYVLKGVLAGDLELGWITVAAFDAACVVIQAVGLRKKWLFDAR